LHFFKIKVIKLGFIGEFSFQKENGRFLKKAPQKLLHRAKLVLVLQQTNEFTKTTFDLLSESF